MTSTSNLVVQKLQDILAQYDALQEQALDDYAAAQTELASHNNQLYQMRLLADSERQPTGLQAMEEKQAKLLHRRQICHEQLSVVSTTALRIRSNL